MSRGIGKTQKQILAWLSEVTPCPMTVKVLTQAVSHDNNRAVSDRQIRRAVYSLADRGLVELRVQPNPLGNPGICVWLPGAMAEFDAQNGGVPDGARPARPPKPQPRTLAGEMGRLAKAAVAFANASQEEATGALADLAVVAMDFKPPL